MEEFIKTVLDWSIQGDRLVWLLVFGEAWVIWKLYAQGRADLISGLKARERMALSEIEALNNSTSAIEKLREAVQALHNAVTLAMSMRGRG